LSDEPRPEPHAALLARFASGDRAAARELTMQLAPATLSLARRMLGDATEAEDVAQEALLRLWKAAPNWQTGQARVTTWLYRVTANLCTDRLRRRRGSSLDQIAEPTDDKPSVEASLIVRDQVQALNQAIAALPDRQRLVIALRHFEERANFEIAEIMDVSVEAVESLLSRARRTLSQTLSPMRDDLRLER
jgi:RNA polymerase sigma factor (sigma-70 family)